MQKNNLHLVQNELDLQRSPLNKDMIHIIYIYLKFQCLPLYPYAI